MKSSLVGHLYFSLAAVVVLWGKRAKKNVLFMISLENVNHKLALSCVVNIFWQETIPSAELRVVEYTPA